MTATSILGLILLSLIGIVGDDQEEVVQQNIDIVSAAILANRQSLQAFEADVVINTGPTENFSHIVCDTGRFRRDNLDRGVLREILVFAAGQWTQYSPTLKIMWIRKPNQMSPSVLPFDPRDLASPNMTMTTESVIRSAQILKGETRDLAGGERLTTITCLLPSMRTHSFVFDSRYGFLPTEAIEYCDDGSINTLNEIRYQRVADRDAWLLQEARLRLFAPGALISAADAERVPALMSLSTELRNLRLLSEGELEGRFDFSVDDGTRVHDVVSGKTSYKGPRPVRATQAKRAPTSRVQIVIVVGVVAGVVCSVALLRNLRRESTKQRREK